MRKDLIKLVLRLPINLPRASRVLVLSIALTMHAQPSDAQTMLPVAAEGITLREVFDSVRSNSPLPAPEAILTTPALFESIKREPLVPPPQLLS